MTTLNCVACGAPITVIDRICHNCGTPNPMFNEHVANPNPVANDPITPPVTPVTPPLHEGGTVTLNPGDPVVGHT